ncbi:MAG TPA: VOC family protein [Pyrinomonadaceae bacterium]|nr:VOC family protein [Pyrinomonadaceae bacterium]
MIGGLSRVILFVDDMAAMKSFYVDILGLRELPGGDVVFVSLDSGGAQLSLHQIPSEYADPNAGGAPREDSYTKFVFHSDDVEGDREALVAKGVRMREINRWGAIELCDGIDPEGNIFQISNR